MDDREIYEFWLLNPYFDEKTKKELHAIADDEHEIKERFYKELEFGTAGIRGIIGAGTNRMNIYTVRKITQGISNYILDINEQKKGVAIAYDSRRMSPEFADEAALCLAANGIKAYIFESLRPTPELSFVLRKLGCVAGINITASHNLPEYNGYKVYWEDGAQITSPHDTRIMDQVQKIMDYNDIKTMDREKAKHEGMYQVIGEEMDDAYIEELKKQVLHIDCIREIGKELKIVYTPLHGSGNILVRRVLKELGFENVYIVKEQELPDGEFPTVSCPNPEAEETFTLGLRLAKEVNADIVLGTDPDADRLGIRVKDSSTGEYHTMTGNMSGCLLADYEIGQRKDRMGLPEDGVMISTIVSTNTAGVIARSYGVTFIAVLTGFKYIGQEIWNCEATGSGTYLFGFEESYGCLIGTHARDKDAIVAAMAICEAAVYYKTKNMTLWDAMLALYKKYGYYKDNSQSIMLKDIEGLAKIQKIMNTLRKDPPKQIGSYWVKVVRDYKEDKKVNLVTGETETTGLPSSNVLYYDLEDDAWLCIRPSGTEAKIKFYYGIKGTSLVDADEKSEKMGREVLDMIQQIM